MQSLSLVLQYEFLCLLLIENYSVMTWLCEIKISSRLDAVRVNCPKIWILMNFCRFFMKIWIKPFHDKWTWWKLELKPHTSIVIQQKSVKFDTDKLLHEFFSLKYVSCSSKIFETWEIACKEKLSSATIVYMHNLHILQHNFSQIFTAMPCMFVQKSTCLQHH